MSEDKKPPIGWKQLIQNQLNRTIARKWFDVGLRNKMTAMVAVGLTGMILIFAFIAIYTIRQTTQQYLSEHVLRARILAENLDTTLSQVAGMLTILSSQIDMDAPQSDLAEWGDVFEKDFQSVQGIYVFDHDLNLLASTGDLKGVDWKQVPSLQSISGIQPRTTSVEGIPRPYAIVVVAIGKDGNSSKTGRLAAILDLSNPEIFISSDSLDSKHVGTLQILDGNGRVLNDDSAEKMLTPATIEKIVANLFVEGKPMVESCLGCTGDEMDETGTVIAFAPLSHAPWGVIIWHEADVLFAPVRRLAGQTVILGALAILGAIGLVFVTTRSVIRPVQVLTDATRMISEEELDASTLKSVECTLADSLASTSGRRRDEIGLLSHSFITMCKRLQLSILEIQSLNRELDARVQARTQQISILNAVALTVNQSLKLDDILDRALEKVLQLTGIDMVAIFLQDASKGDLKLSASRGLSENAARLAYQVGLLDGDCGGVMELGKIVVVPDLSPYRGRGAESLKKEQVNALMHVPLMNKGCALGSMCVGTRAELKFDSEEQDLLMAIGNQIAIAVENARLYSEVQRKERLRGELFSKALAAQEDERRRIARELHDDISQSLTALLYEAEDVLETNTHPSTREQLLSVCDLTRQTLDNIHKLIFDLRPSMLDQLGLIPALRWLAENRLQTRGIRVAIKTGGHILDDHDVTVARRLSPEVETALYRVVQEAMNNIARHAAARNVEINLDLGGSSADVTIQDDGIGFDLVELNATAIKNLDESSLNLTENLRGLGLIGMQERIELLGGELGVLSTPGNGTHIHIHVPIRERSLAND